MYRIDTLTGLYNRRGFEIEYHKLLEAKAEEQQLTIILADLDRLKVDCRCRLRLCHQPHLGL